jgi:hypothetical protein
MQFMVIKKNGTTTLIAEITTIRIFLQEINFFMALVVQNVYQSADKFDGFRITKKGSKISM